MTKLLYDHGYDKRAVIELYRFIDWLIFLPADLQRAYSAEIDRIEEGRKMPYLSLREREAIAKGSQQTGEKLTLRYLSEKFGELDAATTAAIKQLPLARLTLLSDAMFEFKTVSEFMAWLSRNAEMTDVALSN